MRNLKVLINAAMTVDGKIATTSGDSAISSNDDMKRVHKLRARVDAIVIGISTVIADDPELTVRLVRGKNPVRVIVDSTGRIPLNSKIMHTALKIKTIVVVTKHAPKEKIFKIKDMGATVLIAGVGAVVDLKQMFLILERMGLEKVLVEGGGELNWSLLRAGIADELIVTIAPTIVGGKTATTLVEGVGVDKISDGIRLRLRKTVRKQNGEFQLYYKVIV